MQTRSFSTPMASVLAGLALAIGAGPAAAEVDEILVTAQRREESLQDVPIAVSAFTEDQIASRQIDVVKDIGQNVPNLQTYTVTAGAEAIQIHSRGASVQNPGFNLSESPVGVYMDDVYYGRLASVNMDLLDVERIEVLRGPQGTLYGRNTIAGAVKLITRTPGDETWLTGSVGIGNYETTKIGVSLGGPIEEGSLAGSIAAVYDKRSQGWMDNGTTGDEPGEYDNKAARAKIHWYGTSSFDATLTGWVADVDNDGYNGIPYVPFSNDIAGSPNPDYDPAPPNSAPQGGFYETFAAEGVNYGNSQQGGGSLQLSFDFGGVTLKSVSAFASIDSKFGFDLAGGGADFGPVPAAQFGLRIRSDSNFDQVSQELQLLGKFGDSLLWQVGGFYLNEDGQQQFSGTVPGISSTPSFNEAIDNETNSYAVYGEGTYQVSDAFSVTAGLRWTKDEKEYSDNCVGGFCFDDSDIGTPTPGDGSVSLDDDWDETTYKIGADYQLNDDQLVYASYSTGFQAGGYRTLCFGNLSSSCGGTAFDPQTVDSYELGWKSDLADNTLRLNVAAFYAMYDDIQQIVTNNAGGFPIDNIGEVDVYGLEIEATWTPISDLNVYANLGIQESDFGTVDPASPPGGFNGAAPATDELPSNPQWQGKVGFDYTIPLQNSLEFFYGLDIFHSDSYFTEARNLIEIEDYTRLNGFLGLGADDRQWQVMFAATNITDEEDNVSGIFANGFTNIRTPLPPVEYMLTFKVNY